MFRFCVFRLQRDEGGEKGEWEEKWLGRDRQRADVEKKCRRGRKVEARSGWKSWSKGREGICGRIGKRV